MTVETPTTLNTKIGRYIKLLDYLASLPETVMNLSITDIVDYYIKEANVDLNDKIENVIRNISNEIQKNQNNIKTIKEYIKQVYPYKYREEIIKMSESKEYIDFVTDACKHIISLLREGGKYAIPEVEEQLLWILTEKVTIRDEEVPTHIFIDQSCFVEMMSWLKRYWKYLSETAKKTINETLEYYKPKIPKKIYEYDELKEYEKKLRTRVAILDYIYRFFTLFNRKLRVSTAIKQLNELLLMNKSVRENIRWIVFERIPYLLDMRHKLLDEMLRRAIKPGVSREYFNRVAYMVLTMRLASDIIYDICSIVSDIYPEHCNVLSELIVGDEVVVGYIDNRPIFTKCASLNVKKEVLEDIKGYITFIDNKICLKPWYPDSLKLR